MGFVVFIDLLKRKNLIDKSNVNVFLNNSRSRIFTEIRIYESHENEFDIEYILSKSKDNVNSLIIVSENFDTDRIPSLPNLTRLRIVSRGSLSINSIGKFRNLTYLAISAPNNTLPIFIDSYSLKRVGIYGNRGIVFINPYNPKEFTLSCIATKSVPIISHPIKTLSMIDVKSDVFPHEKYADIKSLKIAYMNVDGIDFGKFPKLESLHLRGVKFSDKLKIISPTIGFLFLHGIDTERVIIGVKNGADVIVENSHIASISDVISDNVSSAKFINCKIDDIKCSSAALKSITFVDTEFPHDDLSHMNLPELEEMVINNADIHRITFPDNGKLITLKLYNTRIEKLSDIPIYENLEELHIVHSPLRSIEGIEKYEQLYKLIIVDADLDAYAIKHIMKIKNTMWTMAFRVEIKLRLVSDEDERVKEEIHTMRANDFLWFIENTGLNKNEEEHINALKSPESSRIDKKIAINYMVNFGFDPNKLEGVEEEYMKIIYDFMKGLFNGIVL